MGFLSNTLKSVAGKKVGKIEKRWTFDAKTPISTSPSVGQLEPKMRNVIAFGTKDGKIYTVRDDSSIEWLYSIKHKLSEVEALFHEDKSASGIYCDPVIADINNDGKGEVIAGSDIGKLFVLDSKGKLLWEYKTEGEIRSKPFVHDIDKDGKLEIIFGSNDKNLYVLARNGKLLWRFRAASGIESPPIVFEEKNRLQIIFGSNDGTIYSIDGKGNELWRFKTKGKITAQAAVGPIYGGEQNFIVMGSADNHMYALDTEGNLKWSYATEGRIASQACLKDINKDGKMEIIFGSCDDNIYVLSCNGSKIWSYETDFWVVSTPLVLDVDGDGKLEIVAGSYDHSIYILDAEGTFLLNYMPGISGVTSQSGHYAALMTSQPGQYGGKKIWQYKTEGMVIGCTYMLEGEKKCNLVLTNQSGKVDVLTHKK